MILIVYKVCEDVLLLLSIIIIIVVSSFLSFFLAFHIYAIMKLLCAAIDSRFLFVFHGEPELLAKIILVRPGERPNHLPASE